MAPVLVNSAVVPPVVPRDLAQAMTRAYVGVGFDVLTISSRNPILVLGDGVRLNRPRRSGADDSYSILDAVFLELL